MLKELNDEGVHRGIGWESIDDTLRGRSGYTTTWPAGQSDLDGENAPFPVWSVVENGEEVKAAFWRLAREHPWAFLANRTGIYAWLLGIPGHPYRLHWLDSDWESVFRDSIAETKLYGFYYIRDEGSLAMRIEEWNASFVNLPIVRLFFYPWFLLTVLVLMGGIVLYLRLPVVVIALVAGLAVAYYATFFILGSGAAFRYYFPSYVLLQLAVIAGVVQFARIRNHQGADQAARGIREPAGQQGEEGWRTLLGQLIREPRKAVQRSADLNSVEVSVVMPCLNEADTLASLHRARRSGALREHDIVGEIIVADNESQDDSQAIALRMGARVVSVPARGYGSALMGGIAVARGKFIIMGDADDSYDFLEIPKLVAKLREGFDLVQGCRLPSGGGRVMPGAMPFLHRWVGNPILSFLARWWFKTREIHDVYCGLRGFTRQAYGRLDQRCTGMEFATEMIIKASLFGAKATEVPVILYPDGRKNHTSHLRTFRDGWRTVRLFLMYCPRWLFLAPGVSLVLIGVAGYTVALPGLTLAGITFDAHTLLFSSLAVICGYQAILFAVLTKTFAVNAGLMPEDRFYLRFFQLVNLERGLVVATGALLVGVALLFVVVNQWRLSGFGRLDYPQTMRVVVPGVTLTVLGFQTFLSSFFVSILGMQRR